VRSPAEAIGLSDRGLDALVQAALARISPRALKRLSAALQVQADRGRLTYLRDGEPETVRIFPYPIVVVPEQVRYVHAVTLAVQNALKRLVEFYRGDAGVRALLPLTPGEERWLWDCVGPGLQISNPVFGRLDAIADFAGPEWQDSIRFLEPNLTGVGGLHMVPTCERIVADLVVPMLAATEPGLTLEHGQDVRELLLQTVLDHGRAIGRRVQHLCLVEPKYADSGPEEQQALAEYLRAQYGLRITHADPAELELRAGDVWYDGSPIDIAYRDYAVADLLELQDEGVDIEPMRVLFRQNRVVSSIAGELDHKSGFEVLTSPQYADRYFSTDERQLFRRHVAWTRVLAERRTELPDGHTTDLVPWVRRRREHLVIKPSRGYGGDDVVIGPSVNDGTWDATLQRALAGPDQWVVQELVPIFEREYRIADDDGAIRPVRVFTVLGFFASRDGVAMMARASRADVVNVAQHGGLCAVLIGRA
jgi:hypothetical protein